MQPLRKPPRKDAISLHRKKVLQEYKNMLHKNNNNKTFSSLERSCQALRKLPTKKDTASFRSSLATVQTTEETTLKRYYFLPLKQFCDGTIHPRKLLLFFNRGSLATALDSTEEITPGRPYFSLLNHSGSSTAITEKTTLFRRYVLFTTFD